jgi:hypothetical protein
LRYINLDAPENRETLRNLSTVGWAQTVGHAVIDEAQKEPAVLEKVKYAFDAGEISFTVLTGSSQILLLKKIRESLAGHAFFVEIKSGPRVASRDIRAMLAVGRRLGRQWRGGIVIYTGSEVAFIDHPVIWAVPSRRLFQPVTFTG